MFGKIPRVPKKISDIGTVANDVVKKNRVTKEEYMRRLSVCQNCIFLLKAVDVCKKCGCFTKAKAISPSMTCPIGKWSASEVIVDSTEDNGGEHDSDEIGSDLVSRETSSLEK